MRVISAWAQRLRRQWRPGLGDQGRRGSRGQCGDCRAAIDHGDEGAVEAQGRLFCDEFCEREDRLGGM